MIVLDSSAAISAVVPQGDIRTQARLRELIQSHDCVSPSLYLSETANAIWKEVRFNGLPSDAGRELHAKLLLLTEIHPEADFITDALAIALAHTHPVYDSVFVAMSRKFDAPILTLDEKFRRKFPQDDFLEIS